MNCYVDSTPHFGD